MSTPRTVDVTACIDQRPISGCQWLVMLLCFLIVLVDGFDTAMAGYIAPALVDDLGVPRTALGPVLSAALFGLAAGSLLAGPLADRFGRKPVIVGSVLLFGLWSLAAAAAGSVASLAALRLLTGLGLGAAMSNALTLMSECSPQRRRSVMVNAVFCGFPVGAALSGLLAAWMMPRYGWRGVMLTGGAVPLLLALALALWLPESARHMASRGVGAERIRRTLARLTGSRFDDAAAFVSGEPGLHGGRSAAAMILSAPYRFGSAMLWITYFMGLLIFYVLTAWMPLLMKDVGFTAAKAAALTALFPLGGGVGSLLAGWLMDRTRLHRVVAAAYAATGVLIFAAGRGGSVEQLSALIFLAGAAMNGAQTSMGSLAAAYYPTACRATGVAWMLGFGRLGGILGALGGSTLLGWQLGFGGTFSLLAVPAMIAAAALLIKEASDARRQLTALGIDVARTGA